MKEAYFATLKFRDLEEKDKDIGLFQQYHNTLCFPSKSCNHPKGNWDNTVQTFEGKTKSSTVFLKKAYWIKDLLLVFWQKRKWTEKIISNNEGYINGDGLSKSVFWVTQIGQKWGIQKIYSKIWAKKLPSNEKSPLTVDVRVIDRKQNLFA